MHSSLFSHNAKKIFFLLALTLSLGGASSALAQKTPAPRGDVCVDKQGVLRWQKGRQEVALFGINYTTPFAYSYRALRRLAVPPEQAIEQDVYHLARLDVDAFRVHVWDVEITDTAGNLLGNEHLRLLDFLVARLNDGNTTQTQANAGALTIRPGVYLLAAPGRSTTPWTAPGTWILNQCTYSKCCPLVAWLSSHSVYSLKPEAAFDYVPTKELLCLSSLIQCQF